MGGAYEEGSVFCPQEKLASQFTLYPEAQSGREIWRPHKCPEIPLTWVHSMEAFMSSMTISEVWGGSGHKRAFGGELPLGT